MRLSTRFPLRLLPVLFLLLPMLNAFPREAGAQHRAAADVTYEQLAKDYRAAVQDAQKIRVSKIDTNLTLIVKSNPRLEWKTISGQEYVKMALLTDSFYDAYVGKSLPVGSGRVTWVGVSADFQDWYKRDHPSASALLLRLKQLMGMPPDVTKTRIAEIWVRPGDLKRPSIEPAIDKEIDLATLFSPQRNSSPNAWYRPNGDDVYTSWFYRQCAESYIVPPDDESLYPWTRLGYTYDWGNPTYPHEGISEFIVWGGLNVVVYVDSSVKPESYFH